MTGIIEISIAISGLIGILTVCSIKIIHQIQNSRCTTIKCLGCIDCERDVNIEIPEVITGDIPVQPIPKLRELRI
jgi:hypothetical protein